MSIYKDKVAIITGAGSGIGWALAEELARRGAHVVISDVNTERIEKVGESIKKAGNKVTVLTVNVSDFEAVKKMVEVTMAEHGRLDYIFNNAGIAVGGEARDFSIDDWRSVIEINLYGIVNGVAAAYPIMLRQGSGHIINIGSIEGLIPIPGAISYVASKYGIVGLSNALRVEAADLGVNVSVVCPGYIETPIFYESKVVNVDREKVLELITRRQGLSPEECASEILRGVERNKATIIVTKFAKFLYLLQRTSPGLVLWLGKLYGRRLRKARLKD
ncbi:MAG: SDR family NAD(P)-dependent oxidoreductase [Deltaproteobacteria bacterium]|nr:MAG: SDR family NAD(P)-dependent oxidoreductase [Deltaproteobacteria bacterium]